jgi:uncharacterized membrane protein YhaH (DUF805 family)
MANYPFAVLGVLGACCCIFSLIAVISYNRTQILNLNWFTGQVKYSGETVTLYFSMRGEGYSDTVYDDDYHFTWGLCAANQNYNGGDDASKFCQTCHDSMGATLAFALIALFTSMPALAFSVMRFNDAGNTSSNKMIGAITSFVAMLAGVISLAIFGGQCMAKIQKYYNDNSSIDIAWYNGPIIGLMVTFIIFQFIGGVVNIALPVGGGAASSTANPAAAK